MFGDLKSRTSIKADFIENDRNLCFRISTDEVDLPLPCTSMYHGSNRFGEYLLDLCKAVNLRIVNGQMHFDKSIGRVTCTTHNGESVVDYLFTSQSKFCRTVRFLYSRI